MIEIPMNLYGFRVSIICPPTASLYSVRRVPIQIPRIFKHHAQGRVQRTPDMVNSENSVSTK